MRRFEDAVTASERQISGMLSRPHHGMIYSLVCWRRMFLDMLRKSHNRHLFGLDLLPLVRSHGLHRLQNVIAFAWHGRWLTLWYGGQRTSCRLWDLTSRRWQKAGPHKWRPAGGNICQCDFTLEGSEHSYQRVGYSCSRQFHVGTCCCISFMPHAYLMQPVELNGYQVSSHRVWHHDIYLAHPCS